MFTCSLQALNLDGLVLCPERYLIKSLPPLTSTTFAQKYCTDIPAWFGRPEGAPLARRSIPSRPGQAVGIYLESICG